MTFLELLYSFIGSDVKYQFMTYIFSMGFGLVFIDAIFRFLFGSISSLFYKSGK